MEKVVVPKFVADWYESNPKVTLYGLMVAFVITIGYKKEQLTKWAQSCEGRHFNGVINAQEVVAKMYLFGYEVEEDFKKLEKVEVD